MNEESKKAIVMTVAYVSFCVAVCCLNAVVQKQITRKFSTTQ